MMAKSRTVGEEDSPLPYSKKMPLDLEKISKFPLFQGYSRARVEELCSGGEVVHHSHRALLFEFGQPASKFGLVLQGAYKLSRITPAGEDSILYFCSPGDVIAALIMPQEKPIYPVNVHAMGPSWVLLIRREIYQQEWLKEPALISRIQGLLSSRMMRLQAQKMMQRAPLFSKIASLLLQLVAQEPDSGVEVPIPLTRKEIADSLGVTVESVIRVMSDWEKRHWVITSDRHIRILNVEHLVSLAEGLETPG